MKILSWNILADEFIETRYYPMIPRDLLFNRKKRQERIVETLIKENADIMLLQEVMRSEFNLLYTHFHTAYHLVRGKYIQWQKNKRGYSGNVILLRKSMFFLPQNEKYRIDLNFGLAIQCQLREKKESMLLIANVHLDDILQGNRIKQVKQLEPLFTSHSHIILGGDFNEHYTSKAKLYKTLNEYSFTSYNEAPTYYIEHKLSIDHILLKGFINKKTCKVINDFGSDIVEQFTHYGSDHLPVLLTLK
jgi:endonuclease/exonuclease/phosphatase family metal-dependent hydrolase